MIRLAPFFIVSLVLHGLFLVAQGPWSNPFTLPGDPGATEELLFVEVVAEKELTASAPSPAMIDSIESKESQPEKETHPEEETKAEPPPTPEEPVHEPVVEKPETPQPVLARTSEEPKADFVTSDDIPSDLPDAVELVKEPPKTEQDPQPIEEKKPKTEEDVVEEKKEQETQQEAPKAVASVSQVASRQSVFLATRGRDLVDYKAKVIAAIKKASFYPRKAARRRERGQVIVRFRIWKDGRVDNIEIARSSGSEILDKAAREIVQKAINDFPPAPDFFHGISMAYAVPIVFREKGKSRN